MSVPCYKDKLSPCCECDTCYGKRNHSQVYCTNCNHFILIEDGDNMTPDCKYKDVCDLSDCEDSKEFNDRPYYEE